MNNTNIIVRFCFFLLMLFHHACSNCTSSDHCHIPVITKHEERDLELFDSSNQSHPGIFSILDKTYTVFGKERLRHHLKNPVTDVELLQLRQKQIQILLENPLLLEDIQALLARVKAAEQDLVYFIDNQEDPVARTVIDTFYFKNALLKDFNKSSFALDARNYLKQLGLFSPVVEHLLFHFALSYVQEKLTQPTHNHHHHGHDDYHGHHHHHVSHHDHYCIHDLEAPVGSSALVKGAFTALKAAHLGIHLVSIKEMVQQMGAELAVVNQLYKKVASVKEGLQAIAELHIRMQENDLEVTDNLNANITVFTPLLGDVYFSSQSSLGYLSPIGTTLYTYQVLKKNAASLQACMEHIADIDALVSVAQWYKEHTANNKAPVCFVEFVIEQAPVIRLEGMWHIGLNSDSVVLNDIALSADKGPYKFIITGPNKAGKSTLIKAVGLNIILAQSFGIAAARKAQMTVFHTLLSYMTVTDDVTHDRSTFVAELVRAEECIQKLQSLQPSQHACLLIDDSLFKGTNFEKSQDMALRFLNTIGTFPTSCALVATHCAALTQLEKEKPTVFKNYCIKMKADKEDSSQSMFTLEEGIAHQSTAFDIIKRQQTLSF